MCVYEIRMFLYAILFSMDDIHMGNISSCVVWSLCADKSTA